MGETNQPLRWWRRPRKLLRGQSAVEFALLLPVFMLLFMGVFEFARLAASWITMQHAAAEAARYAVSGINFTAAAQVRENAIIAVARTASLGMNIIGGANSGQAGYYEVTIRSSRSTGNPNEPNDAGGPNDFVRITVHYNHPALRFIFGTLGYVPLTVKQMVINERFTRPTGLAGIVGTPQLPPTPISTFTKTYTPTTVSPTKTATPTPPAKTATPSSKSTFTPVP